MILIIGYGNQLRRDDGVGPALARMVAGRCRARCVRVIEAHQLVPELADEIASPEVSAVIFMDARVVQDVSRIGLLSQDVEIVRIYPETSTASLGHHFAPSALLVYAALLHGRQPPAWLVSVPGADFAYGEGFSEMAGNSLASAQQKVLELICGMT